MSVNSNVSPYFHFKNFYKIITNKRTYFIPPMELWFGDVIYFDNEHDVIATTANHILHEPSRYGNGVLFNEAKKWIEENGYAKGHMYRLIDAVDDHDLKDAFIEQLFPRYLWLRLLFDPTMRDEFINTPGVFECKIEMDFKGPLCHSRHDPRFNDYCKKKFEELWNENPFLKYGKMLIGLFLDFFCSEIFNNLKTPIYIKRTNGYTWFEELRNRYEFWFLCQLLKPIFKSLNKINLDDEEEEFEIDENKLREFSYIDEPQYVDWDKLATEAVRQELLAKAKAFPNFKPLIHYTGQGKVIEFDYHIRLDRLGKKGYWIPIRWIYLYNLCYNNPAFKLISTLLGCFLVDEHKIIDYKIGQDNENGHYWGVFNFHVKAKWVTPPGYLWGFGQDMTGMDIFGNFISKNVLDDSTNWVIKNLESTNKCYCYNIEHFNENYLPKLLDRQSECHYRFYSRGGPIDDGAAIKDVVTFYGTDAEENFQPYHYSSGVRNMKQSNHSMPVMKTPNFELLTPYAKQKLKFGGKYHTKYWNPIKNFEDYAKNTQINYFLDIQNLKFLSQWNDEYHYVYLNQEFCEFIMNNLKQFTDLNKAYAFMNSNFGKIKSTINSIEEFLFLYIKYNFERKFKPWVFKYSNSAVKDDQNHQTIFYGPETGKGGFCSFKLLWKDNPFFSINKSEIEVVFGYDKLREHEKLYDVQN